MSGPAGAKNRQHLLYIFNYISPVLVFDYCSQMATLAVTPGLQPKNEGFFSNSQTLVTVTILVIILYIIVQYSQLVARYNDIYLTYKITETRPNLPVNIGPSRIVFGYEYPTLASTFQSRPIPQPAAEFLLRLIRTLKVPASSLLLGVDSSPGTTLAHLDSLTASKELWDSPQNPLGARGFGKIPYDSHLVHDYIKKDLETGQARDLSLEVVWLYGYEEYVRQRFTSGSTSVLDEWNYMFGTIAAAPATKSDSACSTAVLASDAISSGISLGGIGLMLPFPANVFSSIALAGVGAITSLASKPQCNLF